MKCLQMCGERLWFHSSSCCARSIGKCAETTGRVCGTIHRETALMRRWHRCDVHVQRAAVQRRCEDGGGHSKYMRMRRGRRQQGNCAASWVTVTLLARQPIGCAPPPVPTAAANARRRCRFRCADEKGLKGPVEGGGWAEKWR